MLRYLNRFVGREQELAWVIDRVVSRVPLLTLFGPPGVGKTRLAVEAARAIAKTGVPVHFIALATARSEEDVAERLLSTLAFAAPRTSGARERVVAALSSLGHALVVLDGLEQVSKIAASTLALWAGSTNGLTLLLASREIVTVPGGLARDIRPLSCPTSPNDLESSSAGQMILELIENHAPDYAMTDDERPGLYEILRRTDGLPLAIEIVAPRVALMGSATQRAAHRNLFVSDEPILPTNGGGAQTLRASLEASWSTLDSDEQRLFAITSVFDGGFDVESLAFVLDTPDVTSVMTSLSSLRNKSLLHVSNTTSSRSTRFDTYGIFAHFLSEKLDELRLGASAARRHRIYFAALARQLHADLDRHARATLELEARNIERALERSTATDDPSESLSLASALLTIPSALRARRPFADRTRTHAFRSAGALAPAHLGENVFDVAPVAPEATSDDDASELTRTDSVDDAPGALVVHVEGDWFRPPGGPIARCRTRRAVRCACSSSRSSRRAGIARACRSRSTSYAIEAGRTRR